MMFLLDIAFSIEVISLLGSAALLLQIEKMASPNRLAKFIAYFAMIVAVGGMLCTVYYGIKYRNEGYFEKPSMMSREMMMNKKDLMMGKFE